jgi:hypothetical protein
VVADKILRDIHRWGFPSLEKMVEQTDTTIAKALGLIEKYNAAATD